MDSFTDLSSTSSSDDDESDVEPDAESITFGVYDGQNISRSQSVDFQQGEIVQPSENTSFDEIRNLLSLSNKWEDFFYELETSLPLQLDNDLRAELFSSNVSASQSVNNYDEKMYGRIVELEAELIKKHEEMKLQKNLFLQTCDHQKNEIDDDEMLNQSEIAIEDLQEEQEAAKKHIEEMEECKNILIGQSAVTKYNNSVSETSVNIDPDSNWKSNNPPKVESIEQKVEEYKKKLEELLEMYNQLDFQSNLDCEQMQQQMHDTQMLVKKARDGEQRMKMEKEEVVEELARVRDVQESLKKNEEELQTQFNDEINELQEELDFSEARLKELVKENFEIERILNEERQNSEIEKQTLLQELQTQFNAMNGRSNNPPEVESLKQVVEEYKKKLEELQEMYDQLVNQSNQDFEQMQQQMHDTQMLVKKARDGEQRMKMEKEEVVEELARVRDVQESLKKNEEELQMQLNAMNEKSNEKQIGSRYRNVMASFQNRQNVIKNTPVMMEDETEVGHLPQHSAISEQVTKVKCLQKRIQHYTNQAQRSQYALEKMLVQNVKRTRKRKLNRRCRRKRRLQQDSFKTLEEIAEYAKEEVDKEKPPLSSDFKEHINGISSACKMLVAETPETTQSLHKTSDSSDIMVSDPVRHDSVLVTSAINRIVTVSPDGRENDQVEKSLSILKRQSYSRPQSQNHSLFSKRRKKVT